MKLFSTLFSSRSTRERFNCMELKRKIIQGLSELSKLLRVKKMAWKFQRGNYENQSCHERVKIVKITRKFSDSSQLFPKKTFYLTKILLMLQGSERVANSPKIETFWLFSAISCDKKSLRIGEKREKQIEFSCWTRVELRSLKCWWCKSFTHLVSVEMQLWKFWTLSSDSTAIETDFIMLETICGWN